MTVLAGGDTGVLKTFHIGVATMPQPDPFRGGSLRGNAEVTIRGDQFRESLVEDQLLSLGSNVEAPITGNQLGHQTFGGSKPSATPGEVPLVTQASETVSRLKDHLAAS
jgi:hypothetical protein